MRLIRKRFTIRLMLVLVALVAVFLVAIVRPPLRKRALLRKIEPIGPYSITEPVADHRRGWQKKYWEFVRKKFGHEWASCYTTVVITDPDARDDDLDFILQITTLRSLDLSHTRVTDQFTAKLSRLRSLQSIDLDNTEVTDSSIDSLDDLNLLRLSFRHTEVSAQRRERYLKEHDGVVERFAWSPRSSPSVVEAIRNCVKQGYQVDFYGRIEFSWSGDETESRVLDPRCLIDLPEFGLSLSDTKLTSQQQTELQKATNLVSLGLYRSSCEDVEWLAALPNLRELELNSTHVKNGMSGLENCSNLTHLTIMSRNQISERDLLAFPAENRLTSIKLDYPVGPLSEEVCEHFAGWRSLRTLRLYEAELTAKGWQHVGTIKGLESLDVFGCSLSDTDLPTLASLKNLHSLDVSFTALTDASIEVIKEFRNLRRLEIEGTQISKAGIEQLRSEMNAEVFGGDEDNF